MRQKKSSDKNQSANWHFRHFTTHVCLLIVQEKNTLVLLRHKTKFGQKPFGKLTLPAFYHARVFVDILRPKNTLVLLGTKNNTSNKNHSANWHFRHITMCVCCRFKFEKYSCFVWAKVKGTKAYSSKMGITMFITTNLVLGTNAHFWTCWLVQHNVLHRVWIRESIL